MNDFFGHWNDVRRKLTPPDAVLWLFDFDGTLAPIARRPAVASLPAAVRGLLRKLADRYPRHVGVVSGRAMKQLRFKVGLPGLIYSGPHGFEIQGPGLRWKHPPSLSRLRHLKGLLPDLNRAIRDIPGFRIENKRWTVAVHYREIRPKDRLRAAGIIGEIRNLAARSGFKVKEGLKAIEILSDAHWNKGQAVLRLRGFYHTPRVFYAGDDATDETVFRVMKRSDVSVHIGPNRPSRARYVIRRPQDIAKLLRRILTL